MPRLQAQTALMAMSISETLQKLQATKGTAVGSKATKPADLEVRHYVPRAEDLLGLVFAVFFVKGGNLGTNLMIFFFGGENIFFLSTFI